MSAEIRKCRLLRVNESRFRERVDEGILHANVLARVVAVDKCSTVILRMKEAVEEEGDWVLSQSVASVAVEVKLQQEREKD